MLQTLLRMLQNPTTNSSTGNKLLSDPTNTSLSNTSLSNHPALDLATSVIDYAPPTVANILYSIAQDNPYVIFLFIVIAFFAFTVCLRLFFYIITKTSKKSRKHIPKRIWALLWSPQLIWTGFILGIIMGVDVLGLHKSLEHFIRSCLLSILLWMFYRITQRILHVYSRAILIFRAPGSKMKFFKNKNIFIVISRMTNAAVFLMFTTILLGIWGVELGPILAGLGIVGIVVGLALQDTLSHILGGVSLMLDEVYSEGDYISLDNNISGTIFQIGYRSTKIRSFNEDIIVVPNGALSKMTITNYSQPIKKTRVVKFYKTYAEDATPQEVKDILEKVAKSTHLVLKHPEPYAYFLEPIGNVYSFRLCFYVNSPLIQASVSDTIQQEIVTAFKEHTIRFALEEKVTYFQKPPSNY